MDNLTNMEPYGKHIRLKQNNFMKQTLSIILPTFNESGNIVTLIKTIHIILRKSNIAVEIIVVDDNSPDKTASFVTTAFRKNKDIAVYIRKQEKGLASAILFGIKKATKEIVLVMDTDFNHDPKEIPILLSQLKKNHLVIGSRFVKNGGMENKMRQWLSYLFNLQLKIILGHEINDNLSGFFVMRRNDLMKLPLKNIFKGFGEYFIRLIFAAYEKGFLIGEIPVFYKNRIHGQSKSQFLTMFITYSLCGLRLRFKK